MDNNDEWLMDEMERQVYLQRKQEQKNEKEKVQAFIQCFQFIVCAKQDETVLESFLFQNSDRLIYLVDYGSEENYCNILVKFLYNNNVLIKYCPNEIDQLLNSLLIRLEMIHVNKEHELYLQKLRDIIISVIDRKSITYWDDNLINIISKYVCMPYF